MLEKLRDPRRWSHAGLAFVALLAFASPLVAHDVGSNGFDTDLTLTAGETRTIDLSLAPDGLWDATVGDRNLAGHVPGDGTYDGAKWAVVFHYTSVTIPSTAKVEFTNHPKYAPVVWLVQGAVTIEGEVDLDGEDAVVGGLGNTEPGPGGFRGGKLRSECSTPSQGAGMGPGGGGTSGALGEQGSGGGHASTWPPASAGPLPGETYGNSQVRPLVGGSGGAADGDCDAGGDPGGAGGGAILIASNGIIDVVAGGSVHADGGFGAASAQYAGSGSGGAIRLIGESVQGGGVLQAAGGLYSWLGGDGYIRVEANTIDLTTQPFDPFDLEGAEPEIWPDELIAPAVRVVEIDSVSVPSDPLPSFTLTDPEVVKVANVGTMTAKIAAVNVPLAWNVKIRVVPRAGADFDVPASCDTADDPCPAWTSDPFSMPDGFTALQARATAP